MASGEYLAQACQAGLDVRLGRLRHHRLHRLHEEAAGLHGHAERHPAALGFERLDLDAGLDGYATRLRFEHDSTGWLIYGDHQVVDDLNLTAGEGAGLDRGSGAAPDARPELSHRSRQRGE